MSAPLFVFSVAGSQSRSDTGRPGGKFPRYPLLTEMQAQGTPIAHRTPPDQKLSAPLTLPPPQASPTWASPPNLTLPRAWPTLSHLRVHCLSHQSRPYCLCLWPAQVCAPPPHTHTHSRRPGLTTGLSPLRVAPHCVHLCAPPSPSPMWAQTMLGAGAQPLLTWGGVEGGLQGGQMQPQLHWPVLTPPFPSNGIKLPWQEAGRELT